MAPSPTLRGFVDHRLWVYLGGLAAILGLRTVVGPSTIRALAVGVVLGLMALTYAAELWRSTDAPVRPWLVVTGVLGVVGGSWVALTGSLAGLLFVAGGLLFLNRGLGNGRSP